MPTPPQELGITTAGAAKILDHMKAEILLVMDSKFTCLGANNVDGGSDIDHFIISEVLLAAVKSIKVETSVP